MLHTAFLLVELRHVAVGGFGDERLAALVHKVFSIRIQSAILLTLLKARHVVDWSISPLLL